jgi:hypothetical protein
MTVTEERKLEPGTKYKVTFSDCCIEGHVVGTFQEWITDEDGDPEGARFDVGEIGPMWGQWSTEEVLT